MDRNDCRVRAALVALASGWAMFLANTGVTPAAATLSGPCSATVNGVDVSGLSAADPDDAISVDRDGTITAAVSSDVPVGEYRIEAEYAGITWTIAQGESSGGEWTASADVDDFARFGVGLYRVNAISDGCAGTVLINIEGSPLATVAGWAAIAMVGAGVAATTAAATRRRPRGVPLVGAGLGAIGGVGTVVLLQQFGVIYPTTVVMIAGAVIGAAVPIGAHLIARLSRRRPAPATAESPPLSGSRKIGPGGLESFASPENAAFPGHTLQPGTTIEIGQTVGDRVLVRAGDGWTGWVALAAVAALRRDDEDDSPPPPPAPPGPAGAPLPPPPPPPAPPK